MRWYRRNADEDLRELERRAATGDPEAQRSLNHARLRAGHITQLEFDMERAAMGEQDAIDLLIENEDVHPSLICQDVYYPCRAGGGEPKLRQNGGKR